jgi:hypothetical protein
MSAIAQIAGEMLSLRAHTSTTHSGNARRQITANQISGLVSA